jgi:transcriptional regulator with XRE-family HTH domain
VWGYYMNELGQRVKVLRISKQLNQDELAQKCGISQPAIAKIERGLTKSVKGVTLEKLAVALSTTTNFLLYGSKSEEAHEDEMMLAEISAIFRDLPTSDKEMILRMARGILPIKIAQKTKKAHTG